MVQLPYLTKQQLQLCISYVSLFDWLRYSILQWQIDLLFLPRGVMRYCSLTISDELMSYILSNIYIHSYFSLQAARKESEFNFQRKNLINFKTINPDYESFICNIKNLSKQ